MPPTDAPHAFDPPVERYSDGSGHACSADPLDSPLAPLERPMIEAILPHRPPFLFVDRIDGRRGARLDARFAVPADAAVWPGAAVIEGLAQCAQLAVSLELIAGGPPADRAPAAGLVGRIQAAVHGPVQPGETLRYSVERQQVLGSMMRFTGRADVDGRTVVEATLVATRRVDG